MATRKRYAVLGTGAFGTAMALVAARRGHQVTLWGRDTAHVADIRAAGENRRALPGVAIPQTVRLTADAAEALAGADAALLAVPTKYARRVLEGLRSLLPPGLPIVSLAKGIEVGANLTAGGIIRDVLGEAARVAVLSGPSHAEEVARLLPTTVVVASAEPALAAMAQADLSSEVFRVYTNPDVRGVELAGAMKNVIAVAAGICDGLGFGDNTKAALLTRGLAEMVRFGLSQACDPATFHGLAGIGDLITTCVSPYGRNRAFGEQIGKGRRRAEIEASMPAVAEGVLTCKALHDLAARADVDMPITTEVYRALYEDKDPRRAVRDLMTREHKQE
ncbi:MAG: NAD(P)-dependent glycerol-3-phosphate dehydrogenase [Planctomycetes bacterium]|nr:NAD(P)-dependent glycerol-3-phosphate dehydrogenase [Planctomycetota bacterium]